MTKRTKEKLCKTMYDGQITRTKKYGYNKVSYSRKEFKDWLFLQQEFHELFDKFAENDFFRDDTPSIDRLDDYKGYSFDNIQIITLFENREKYYNNAYNGVNRKKLRKVFKFDLNNNFIKEYYSVAQAERENDANQANIRKTCNGERNKAGGFVWKWNR